MIEVLIDIDVKAPPDEVFAFWSDHANNPSWQNGMKSCTWTSEPPIGVGSTYDQEASFLGRPITTSFEVVEFEPGTKIRITSTVSTLPLDITREVAPTAEGGTNLKATIRGEPGGLMKLMNPLSQRMVARNVNRDYARLKVLLDDPDGR
ncbi:MAG: SRPBCC family protein [Acidimicrobiales bacterium]